MNTIGFLEEKINVVILNVSIARKRVRLRLDSLMHAVYGKSLCYANSHTIADER